VSALTATLRIGTRLRYDGESWTTVGLESDRVTLRSARGRLVQIHTATLLSHQSTRLIDTEGTADTIDPVGIVLSALTPNERRVVSERFGHLQELLTGYRSGSEQSPLPGEPRPQFDPALVPLAQRYEAKATELGVTVRTLARWVSALRETGPAGLVDRRLHPRRDPLRGVDPRWLDQCRLVLEEHTEASRPTKQLVLERVRARVEVTYGPGEVPLPGRTAAYAVLTELTRGSNAFTGSTKGKRSIANRPQGVYGRLRPTRPGEYLLLDTTPLDVFAMEPLTLRWVQCELTIAMDLYARTIVGLRLSARSTKAVDAAVVMFEAVTAGSTRSTGIGLLPYGGLPSVVVVDADKTSTAPTTRRGLPGVAPESVVVDHGKIYLSDLMLSVCTRLGASVQPARPMTPTDKAAVERFFRTLGEQLLAALPGYKGPDVYSRGKAPEEETYFFIDELEQIIREWISEIYHRRPHDGLVDPAVPGLDLSPQEMFDHGVARCGILRIPARPDLVYDFLPTAWRTIQHYGIELRGLRYDGPVLSGYRNQTSSYSGVNAGKWPLRFDPDDISKVYFCDPADHQWHVLRWEHAGEVPVPFSAETLAYARRLALAQGRHVDDRQALAELLERWDAGLTHNPVERRMALRASAQRAARLHADGGAGPNSEAEQILALPAVEAVRGPGRSGLAAPQPAPPDPLDAGDDDAEGELTAAPADEPAPADGEDFYAEALGVLR
jgi:transposase InsO family protein